MEIYKKGDIYECQFTYSGDNWEQYVFLLSDVHQDAKDCDRAMLKRDLEYAKRLGAEIFVGGDYVDCMGGKYDPRTHKGDLRPEYEVPNYYDVVEDEAVKSLEGYNIRYMGKGNHEENILHRHEIDLTARIAKRVGAVVGSYSDFIRFSFYNEAGSSKRHKDLYRDHSSGGASPVTRDVIGTARRAAIYDADIVWTEHTHTKWAVPLRRERVDKMGSIRYYTQMHVKTGTYNEKPTINRKQWDSKFGPPSMGGVMLRFSVEGQRQSLKVEATVS